MNTRIHAREETLFKDAHCKMKSSAKDQKTFKNIQIKTCKRAVVVDFPLHGPPVRTNLQTYKLLIRCPVPQSPYRFLLTFVDRLRLRSSAR